MGKETCLFSNYAKLENDKFITFAVTLRILNAPLVIFDFFAIFLDLVKSA